jgi:hypothetical protein
MRLAKPLMVTLASTRASKVCCAGTVGESTMSQVFANPKISVAAATVVVGLVFGALVIAARGGSDTPQRPALDVPQSAVSEQAGIRLSIDLANFSGTATWLNLAAEVLEDDTTNPVVRVVVPPAGVAAASLPLNPGSVGASLAPGSSTALRLGPASLARDPVVALNTLDLVREDGTQESVAGPWELVLDTPDDFATRLAVEHLGASTVSDGPITIGLEAAVRSITETLVTVRVESGPNVEHLAEPALLVDGELVHGVLIARHEGGSLLTFSFPPTEFGKPADLRFGPFVAAGDYHNGSATIDVGAIIARTALTGETGEVVNVLPADHIRVTGDAVEVRSFGFSQHTGPGDTESIAMFTIEGILDGIPYDHYLVTGSDGSVPVTAANTGYSQDASGTIHSPRTEIGIPFDSLDELDDEFTITVTGAAADLIRGDWTMTLRPGPVDE